MMFTHYEFKKPYKGHGSAAADDQEGIGHLGDTTGR